MYPKQELLYINLDDPFVISLQSRRYTSTSLNHEGAIYFRMVKGDKRIYTTWLIGLPISKGRELNDDTTGTLDKKRILSIYLQLWSL